ncbi:hypothetical protein CKAN_00625600 [Cinnamomum micranthum f. kanehirae]|uniref:Uncharacterized protein n=1 Tax=Cinnamomum micranthum f. kanehirae TaxID=337451 RepID=A0A3S4NIQ1_9MAGN|nr:hypothetical protein CKAN_00625600 [Cinnamomum micranthum f. kanehirae]
MPAKDEPLLPCLDRLDMMVGHLEEIKSCNCNKSSGRSSSCTSVASNGTVTSDSLDSSPKKSLEKRCRPIDAVIIETQMKGSLFDRLLQLEVRVLKLFTVGWLSTVGTRSNRGREEEGRGRRGGEKQQRGEEEPQEKFVEESC